MDYITVREAAEKWQVSPRLVQQLCIDGRVEGAQKFSGSWAIPADAEKPEDPRKARRKRAKQPEADADAIAGINLMPLMNTPFSPGSCRETIEAMADGCRKDIAWAEYHYFSGQAEKAMQESEQYLIHQCLCLSDHGTDRPGPICAGGNQTDLGFRQGKRALYARHGSLCGLCFRSAAPSSPAGGAAADQGVSAPAAQRAAGLCPVCAGPLSLPEGGVRPQRRNGGGNPGHGGGRIPHFSHLCIWWR